MERVKKILHKGKEIVFVDYSNVKNEDEMISIHKAHMDFAMKENKKYIYVADYTGTYTTPKYVKEVTKSLKESRLILKGGLIGMTGAKAIILSSLASLFKLNIKACNDKNQDFEYVISET